MITYLRRWLIGHPLATAQAVHERLTKKVALAVFSSDALSSTAYATEEILLVLAVAAAATASGSFFFVLPISLAIAVLLWIVGISYRQTIYAYPSGGGAYIVAKDNLGTVPGLTAGGGPGKSGAQRIGDGPPPLPQWDDPWCVQRDAPGPLVLPRWQRRRQRQHEIDRLLAHFQALFRERKYGKHPGLRCESTAIRRLPQVRSVRYLRRCTAASMVLPRIGHRWSFLWKPRQLSDILFYKASIPNV